MHDDDALPSDAPAPQSSPSDRYVITKEGVARDRFLDRAISLHSSDVAGSDELFRTAKFLGRLEHAGLPCVLDFVRTDQGAQLVTRSISGITLASAVAQRAQGQVLDAIADPAACTFTFINVCNALMAAHVHGVVHGAMNPNAIVIGHDGAIEITGWDQAIQRMERPMTMRFTAHTPTPTNLPLDGLYEDIRGLGVCLYTALVGEAPPRDNSGKLAVTSRDAANAIPPALEAVIRAAMASTAAEGYHAIADLRADLLRFLTGQTPKAIAPGQFSKTMDWISTHQRALMAIAAIVVAIVGLVLFNNWKSVKTYATWGSPLVVEDFSNDSWKTRWTTIGNWDQRDGKLVSASEYDCILAFRQRLSPPVAIEYTGSFSSHVRPGDLSVWWCEEEPKSNVPGASQIGRFIQAGANENSWCTILQSPENVRSEVTPLVLKPDVEYHIRVEIETDHLRMWIDGTQVLDHRELFPIGSGILSLYSWDPGKTFDNVRVWQRGIPELISPLVPGDVSYRAGRYAEADTLYGRVATSHAGKPLGEQALFFQGLSQRRMGDHEKAWETWKKMPDGILRHRAECLTIDDRVEHGDVKAAIERFTAMWKERPDIQEDLRQRWAIAGQHLNAIRPLPIDDLTAWIGLRDTCFGNDRASGWLVALMLDGMQRWEDVLTRFPEDRRSVGTAMLALGRNKEVLSGNWTTSEERVSAMVGMGDLEGALRSPDLHRNLRVSLLCKLGRADEAALINPYPAMLYLPQTEDRFNSNGYGSHTNEALVLAGRLEEAAGPGIPGAPQSGRDPGALILLGRIDEAPAQRVSNALYRLHALLAAGRLEQARLLRPSVIVNHNAAINGKWFAQGVGLALIDTILGDPNALRQAIEKGALVTDAWGGRMAVVCQAALDSAKDADVLAMPWKTEAQAWLHVAQALRGELAGDPVAARAGWQAFAALPYTQRMLDAHNLNLELETCVQWRLSALK